MSVSIKAARFGIAMIVGIGLLVVLRSKSAGTVRGRVVGLDWDSSPGMRG